MDEPFGAPLGKMVDLSGVELKNDFTSIQSQNVEDMLQSSRIQPRQVGTGVMRGTQRVISTDGSYITIGEIPDSNGEFGIAHFNADGTLIKKSTAEADYRYGTDGDLLSKTTGEYIYFYNRDTGNNTVQIGELSNGTSGAAAFAKDGNDLVDALGT